MGAVHHMARAANDNAPRAKLTSTTEGSAALSVTQMSYDGVGRVICTAARENAAVFGSLPDACTQSAGGSYGPDPITKAAYDLAGQALTETRGYGTPLAQAYTTFTWGADGEKLSVMDANSNTIHLGYDGFNRLNKITHPDATFETSVYDPDGDLVIWTNRGGYGVVRCGACPRAGQRPDPGDVLNRKLTETGITGASLSGACATGGTTNTQAGAILPRTFGYDLAGRLTGANIPNYPLSWAYDAAGRPTARGTWPTTYGWDNAGNLQTLGYPDGATVVTYQYDPLNRTTKALIGTQSYGSLTYDALGRRQKLSFLGGSSQTWNYDNADRVTSIAHVFPNETVDNVTFSYGYDPSGRDATRTLDNSAYAYVPSAASTSYTAANTLNQYPSVGGYPYNYWPAGELNQTDAFQANYDEFGKLMLAYITPTPGVIDPNNGEFMGEDALDHVYFHGRSTVAGGSHPFIYHSTDGLRPETIFETLCLQTGSGVPTCTGAGTGTRLYVLGPDPDERWAYIGSSGGIYEPHTDREGTLIALSQGGAAAQIYTWDAYGQNSAPSNDNGTGPPGYLYRYTGQRFDPNTSLYDYKARTYSPGLGRFLQPDPAGVDQGPNLNLYVGDDPVNKVDSPGTGPIQAGAKEEYAQGQALINEGLMSHNGALVSTGIQTQADAGLRTYVGGIYDVGVAAQSAVTVGAGIAKAGLPAVVVSAGTGTIVNATISALQGDPPGKVATDAGNGGLSGALTAAGGGLGKGSRGSEALGEGAAAGAAANATGSGRVESTVAGLVAGGVSFLGGSPALAAGAGSAAAKVTTSFLKDMTSAGAQAGAKAAICNPPPCQ